MQPCNIPDDVAGVLYVEPVNQLHKVLSCRKVDVRRFIEVAARFNWMERLKICSMYNAQFVGEETLDAAIWAQLSGNARALVRGLFKNRYEFWAQILRSVLERKYPSLQLLTIYTLIQAPSDMSGIAEYFGTSSLLHAIQNKYGERVSSSNILQLITAHLCTKKRTVFDQDEVLRFLTQLDNCKEAKMDTKTATHIIKLLTQMSFKQLNEIDVAMAKEGCGLVKLLGKIITNKDHLFGFQLAAEFSLNPVRAVAQLLRQSVKGAGTDNDLLSNLTVLFSDYMRDKINSVYEQVSNGSTLSEDIKSDTSGHFRSLLLAFWGFETN